MSKKKTSDKKPRKTKVYQCAHYEFDCDDLGKFYWCHNPDIPYSECTVGRGFYCQRFCPGYKKGKIRGEWAISKWEKDEAKKFKEKYGLTKGRNTMSKISIGGRHTVSELIRELKKCDGDAIVVLDTGSQACDMFVVDAIYAEGECRLQG